MASPPPCLDDDVFRPNDDRAPPDGESFVEPENVSRRLRRRPRSVGMSERDLMKKVKAVVDQVVHTPDDLLFLEENKDLVKLVKQRRTSYSKLKERLKEVEDTADALQQKSKDLAEALRTSSNAVLYTGAGISTSANIPDYRGPEGVWTRLQTGKPFSIDQSIVTAEPTFAHMAIVKLVDLGLIKHVVSQNCDGLHIRSGVPVERISEIHGNMFCERCSSCGKGYYRIYDVTERTGVRRHYTGRTCDVCDGKLKDTIVHFGERSASSWPHYWPEAEANVEKADLIVCLGSSLKVLRSYKQLWLTDRPKRSRPKLYIVNMQWTPKDSQADLKINGRADDVMQRVMSQLNLEVTSSQSAQDCLLSLATSTKPSESDTFRTRCIRVPAHLAVAFPEQQEAGRSLAPQSLSPDARHPLAVKSISMPGCSDDRPLGEDDESRDEKAVRLGSCDMPGWFGKGRKVGPKRCARRRRRKITY